MTTTNAALRDWVADVAHLTRPDRDPMVRRQQPNRDDLIAADACRGDLITLNQETHPDCYLHRSHPVRRRPRRAPDLRLHANKREDAGPNNHWMAPADAHGRSTRCSTAACAAARCTSCRTAWDRSIRPTRAAAWRSPTAPTSCVNMRIMTRMGAAALARIEREGMFVRGLHSIGDLDPERALHHAFPRRSRRSRALGPATAATRCSARNAMRCASQAGRRARKAGSPNTC